ncbi:MAG TPA: ATP-dependent DNA helicase [Steroidobacteraceae bacterium]|nr:ATP-dependent DNA helicase [Steroidobacteraceae bacterium]
MGEAGAYARLLGPQGPLARVIEGFESRREQQRMADWVGETLASRGMLAIEAGTGTGKTFAYLVPALLSGRQVIISTGTRTLQDQLFHRDLPTVSKALGRPVRVALLKGRANYLCRHRLDLAESMPALPGMESPNARTLSRIRRWARHTSSGDLSEIESLRDTDPAWTAVTSTRENCLGAECPEFSRCHVVAARREAQAADIVVVNHHLLLADLALKDEGFGELLPGTEAVILDEAHQVPEIAAQFFGRTVSSRQVAAFARDALAELSRAGHARESARQPMAALESALAGAQAALAGQGERIEWDALPQGFVAALEAMREALEQAAAEFAALDGDDAGLRQCARRAGSLLATLQALLDEDGEGGLRWAEAAGRGFSISFTPFEVATRLGELMRAQGGAWIFTSATLAVGDDFSHFLGRIGANGAQSVRIDSPFDFERQALLYLPPGMPDPASREFTARVVETAMPLVEAAGGRSFLLFTSHRALREAARILEAMPGFTRRYPLLVQGEAPRESLLKRFRELGNAVLLGTASFWEGVDVRGHALALVVIDKLPFAAPEDPLLKARLEGIRRRGGNPFREFQLPQAVLALKQGFGRLIRDREDFGVVAICDPRLRTRGYGAMFLASLPPARVVTDAADAADFLRRRLAEAGLAAAEAREA